MPAVRAQSTRGWARETVDTHLAGARGKVSIGEHRELKTPEEATCRAERDAQKPPKPQAWLSRSRLTTTSRTTASRRCSAGSDRRQTSDHCETRTRRHPPFGRYPKELLRVSHE